MRGPSQKGFTLIELMIVAAVIAILAAIGYPSYMSQVRKSNRAAAQAQMLDIANRQQQYLIANRQYASKAELQAAGFSLPTEVSSKYDWTVTPDNAASPPTYTITFTPNHSSQAPDGAISLTSTGVKSPADKWK